MENPAQENSPSRPRRLGFLWILAGLAVGLGIPLAFCVGGFFLLAFGMTAVGASSGAGGVPIYVSGPLAGPAIAVVEVNGSIVSGRATGFNSAGLAAAEDVIDSIRFAEQDPDVRAILLKVDSPGGSVVASDQIYEELGSVSKPVVVLMGELAASGGYYISMAGDHLIANPNSLTGSIGVISTLPNAEVLFEKIGVEFTVFTSGDAKDFGSLYRAMTPEEIEYWQAIIDETHDGFVEIVVAGRDLSEAEVRELADGRVFTGRQALELGLIDQIGYENDAIKKAANLGNISGAPRIIRYSGSTDIFALLGGLANLGPSGLPSEFLDRILAPSLDYRWMP